jgi:hypothetical protein
MSLSFRKAQLTPQRQIPCFKRYAEFERRRRESEAEPDELQHVPSNDALGKTFGGGDNVGDKDGFPRIQGAMQWQQVFWLPTRASSGGRIRTADLWVPATQVEASGGMPKRQLEKP